MRGHGGSLVGHGGPPPHARAFGWRAVRRDSVEVLGSDGSVVTLPAGRLRMFSTEVTLAANGVARENVRLSSDAAFLLTSLRGGASGPFSVKVADQASGRDWSNRALWSDLTWGTARSPYVLREPVLLPPNAVLSTEIADLAGAANTVEIAFEGSIIEGVPEDAVALASGVVPFWYGATGTLAAAVGAELTLTIRTNADAPFYLDEITADPLSGYDIQIRRRGGGFYYFDRPIRASIVAGIGIEPGFFSGTSLIPPNEDIEIVLTNTSGAGITPRIQLGGVKVYG